MEWPNGSEQLFKSDGDWWNNACVTQVNPTLDLYAEGYLKAAEVLVEHVEESGRDQDYLVYPVCFLFRQFIELRLKDLIILGNTVLGTAVEFPQHHDVERLWKQAEQTIRNIYAPNTPLECAAVGELIAQFHNKDRFSTAFRYPFDRKGALSLVNTPLLNLRNLRDVMKRLASFLNCMQCDIKMRADWVQENGCD